MKRRGAALSCAVAGALTLARPAAAARRMPVRSEPVRVYWLQTARVPAAQRPEWTRLLIEAAEGRPLRSAVIRDSRPRVDAGWVFVSQHEDAKDTKPNTKPE